MPHFLKRFLFATLGLLATATFGAQALRVGVDIDGEPITLLDPAGAPTGFAVELFNAVAQEAKLEIVYVAKPWAELLEDFKGGRIDAFANMAYTDERFESMDFAVHHLELPRVVFVRKDDVPVNRPEDLRGRRIASKPGNPTDAYLHAHGWAQNLVPAASLREALRGLNEKRLDVVIATRALALKHIADDRLTNIASPQIILPELAERLHIAVRPGDRQRLALINEGLAAIRANGTYDRLYEKWIGPLEPRRLQWREVRPYVLVAILILAVTLAALVWQRRLLGKLAQQTEAFRRSEERLTLVLEGSEDGFWDWDLRSNLVERSERWAAMLGYTRAEIPLDSASGGRLVHPEDLPRYEEFRSRLRSGAGSRYDIEYRMRSKSGEWRWILDRGKVVGRASDGTPLRIAGTHTDITSLKQAREDAARQAARFRFIYENAPVGISWVERHLDETRLVNPAHERITGVSVADSRDSKNYVAASHPADRALQSANEEKLYRGEIDHFAMEKRYVHASGKIVWAMLTMHLYRDPVAGDVQEVTTLVDISDLKRTEADRENLRLKMLESQKLESLGVLAGGIAHDFNNLLTVILANASFVRSGEIAPEEPLAHIEAAARRAADLCRQMLAYAGRGNFVVEQLDIGNLVEDTAQLLHVSISKKAHLEFALSPGLPPVSADASQLQQVVMNLVINASDALGERPGKIQLSTRLARPDPASAGVTHSFDLPEGDCVCLEVADTGQGMDAATIARIFDPFFTTKFTGRGLGLAAVLGIVRTHHGALTVESARGKGSTFRLFLPAVSATQAPVAPAPAAATSGFGGGSTILVADDEPSVRTTADVVLRRHGYKTVLAANGQEALERFREDSERFAAIILDLTMPGLDGAEVLRAIRAEHPGVRALMMSGFTEEDVVDRLRDLGDVAILRKPFTHDLLVARVAEIARRPPV